MPGGISVSGWASDADGDSVSVRVTVGGTTVGTLTANQAGAPNGAWDAFSGLINVPTATGVVCVTAVNIGGGTDTSLGCSTWYLLHDPIVGGWNSWDPSASSVVLSGWAYDPDTASPIQVTVTDSTGATYGPYMANLSRPDAAAAYPGYGDAHGFSITLKSPGPCVTVRASNVGAGSDLWWPLGPICMQ